MFNNVILTPTEVEKLTKDLYEGENKMDGSEIIKESLVNNTNNENPQDEDMGEEPMVKNVAVKPGFFMPLANKLKGYKNP